MLSAFFAALTAIFAKIGIKNVNTDLATAIRTLVVLFIAWGLVFLKGGAGTMSALTRTNLIFLCLSGAATGFSWIFYFKALQLGDVCKVAPIDKLSVAIAVILAVIFLKEALTLKTALGALLVISGTVLIII